MEEKKIKDEEVKVKKAKIKTKDHKDKKEGLSTKDLVIEVVSDVEKDPSEMSTTELIKSVTDKLNNKKTSNVNLFTLLTVLFVGLKLTGYVTWSWVWVLAPAWIPAAIGFFLLILLLGIGFYLKNSANKDVDNRK